MKVRVDAEWPGIHSNAEGMGVRAVEMVVGLMTRGETGLSVGPDELLVLGRRDRGAPVAVPAPQNLAEEGWKSAPGALDRAA